MPMRPVGISLPVLLLCASWRIDSVAGAVAAVVDSAPPTMSSSNNPPSGLSAVHPNDIGDPSTLRGGGAGSSIIASAIYNSSDDQALWLDRHNWLRSDELVWEAADMTKLEWDFALAEEAHAAIKSCATQPSEAPGLHMFIDSSKTSGGGGGGNSSLDRTALIEGAIQNWGVNELFGLIPKLEVPANNQQSSSGASIGKGLYNHYSQIVWSKTSHVGCAYTVCSHGRLAACKYSPAGNIPGVGWYEYGDSCSKCPVAEAPSCSNKLCVDSNIVTIRSSIRTDGAFTLDPKDSASNLYQSHKIRSLQLTLGTVLKQRSTISDSSKTNIVTALSDTAVTTGTICNDTSAKITQDQLSLLNPDNGLSPLAVIFGLFLGVSVILVMIVCIMHATKPKKNRQTASQQQQQDKDSEDERVQVI